MSLKLLDSLRTEFGARILGTGQAHGDETVVVSPADLPAVVGHLKERESCELLADVAGVDYPDREKRFEVNYLLRSVSRGERIRVKVNVAEGEAVPSLTPYYTSADS